MIFLVTLRAVALAATVLSAGVAAATPYQVRADAGPARAEAGNCPRAAIGETCDNVAALLDTAAAGQGQPTALYQDLLTPLEDGSHADQRTSEAASAPAAAQAATPVPEQRPYTMLLVGLGLLVFKSRKKRTEKFSA
jgi:hypothetical protein